MSHMPTTEQPASGTAVANTRLVSTTAPLSGGGDLTEDRTLSLSDLGVSTAKLADAAVTLAKMADLAAGSILGRGDGIGVPQALTGAQATSLLDAVTSGSKGLAPASGGGSVNFLRADGTWAEPPGAGDVSVINVKDTDYGATGDGVTDDRAAIVLAVAAALAAGPGADLVFPPGTYKISKYIDFAGFTGLRIRGSAFAVIQYPSDTAIATDAVATSTSMSQSAFLLRYCNGVTVEGLTFIGAKNSEITFANVGSAIYARYASGTTVRDCTGIYGAALFAQDAQGNTTGTGDSIAVASGVVTLTDAAAGFSVGHRWKFITVVGCSNPANNGTFLITTATTTTVTFANAAAIAETSSFSWSVADGDRNTLIDSCRSYGCHSSMRTGNDSVIRGCTFELPGVPDATGLGEAFTVSGTTVTLTDRDAKFLPSHNGRRIKITGSTSAANDGLFVLTYIGSTQVSFTNASGVAELIPSTGKWWIIGGEKTGIGAGATALAVSGSTVTLTASSAIFDAGDVGKTLRITHATTVANNGAFTITEYVSPTVVKYTYTGTIAETYAQGFSVDTYDRSTSASGASGSSHAIYIFAGRSNVLVEGCLFRNIRTTCFKVSGSSLPIRNAAMKGCTAIECGSLATLGADDSQDHEMLSVEDCTAIDCGNGRRGWSESHAITVYGATGVSIRRNRFHYTRNAIASVDGATNLAGIYAIGAQRYVSGASQPLIDIAVEHNKFTVSQTGTSPSSVLLAVINFNRVGHAERTGLASFTLSGTTITMATSAGLFAPPLVGSSITIVNSSGGNDGTFTITGTSGNNLTYENGAGSTATPGTYRIAAAGSKRGGSCRFVGNEALNVAPTGVYAQDNVGLSITDNVFRGCEVNVDLNGDCQPVIARNRDLGRGSDGPSIRFNGNGVSWPIVHDNFTTQLGTARGWGWGIGYGATYRDFPLLGKTGRALPSDGKEEVVVAYGSNHVDGDTLTVTGTGAVVYTYKTTAPAGNEFNSLAGLIALIDAQAGLDCTDYGAGFDDSAGTLAAVTTGHLRIRAAAATATTDGTLTVSASTLYPTALVLLTNTASPNATCGGRGSGSAGPTADKIVIWSPLCQFYGVPNVIADNAAAATVLVAGGFWKKGQIDGRDGGSNDLIQLSTTTGTEQFRWSL